MVDLLYRYPRKYAEELFRVYTDTSKYFHNRIRASFLRGQQLWDDDINGNFRVWDLWRPRDAIYRKYRQITQRPPFFSPTVDSVVLDPKHVVPPDDEAINSIYYYSTGMKAPIYLPPLPGQMCYVKADRNVVGFTGAEWLPILKFNERDVSIEIAMFFSKGSMKKESVIAVYVVQRAFVLTAKSGQHSRVRGLDGTTGVTIRKNGVDVARVIARPQITWIRPTGDTVFQVGDKLEVYMNDRAAFGNTMALTILGEILA